MYNRHKINLSNDSNNPGKIYVVATPIGNLADISQRAVETLKNVDMVVAEDTRHSHILLRHLGLDKKIISLHEHNEREKTPELIQLLKQGLSLALISDAGTPLISDPGYFLITEAYQQDVQVVPIPGPCALIAALSCSGLRANHFCFQGFLSNKASARRIQLENLVFESRTMIFYEAPHRIVNTLEDMISVFGTEREASLARELTKTYETIIRAPLGQLLHQVMSDPNQQRGEFVVMIAGKGSIEGGDEEDRNHEIAGTISVDTIHLLRVLLEEMPIGKASSVAAKIMGLPKKQIYEMALKIQGHNS